jgi:hypothetical protein
LHGGRARPKASPRGDIKLRVGGDGGAAVVFLEALGDDDLRSDPGVHPAPTLESELLDRDGIRVDRCDDHSLGGSVGEPDRDDAVLEGRLRRDDGDDAGVDGRDVFAQRCGKPTLLSQGAAQEIHVDIAQLEQVGPDATAVCLLRLQPRPELLGGKHAMLKQQLPEPHGGPTLSRPQVAPDGTCCTGSHHPFGGHGLWNVSGARE